MDNKDQEEEDRGGTFSWIPHNYNNSHNEKNTYWTTNNEETKQTGSEALVRSRILEAPRMSILNFKLRRSRSVRPELVDNERMSQTFASKADPGILLPPSATISFPFLPPIDGVIPGLEPLQDLDRIIVQESLDIFQTLPTTRAFKRYTIYNLWEQRIFFVVEYAAMIAGKVRCLASRPFYLELHNCKGEVVVTMERKCTLGLCLFGGQIFGSIITVRLEKTREILGQVKQNWSFRHVNYDIIDKHGRTVLKILNRPKNQSQSSSNKFSPQDSRDQVKSRSMSGSRSPPAYSVYDSRPSVSGKASSKYSDESWGHRRGKKGQGDFAVDESETPHFTIYRDNVQIGRVYQDILVVFNCSASYFGLTFPVDLDPVLKLLLLAAGFGLDFSYFYNSGRREEFNLRDYYEHGDRSLKMKFCTCCCCCICFWFCSFVIVCTVIALIVYSLHYRNKK